MPGPNGDRLLHLPQDKVSTPLENPLEAVLFSQEVVIAQKPSICTACYRFLEPGELQYSWRQQKGGSASGGLAGCDWVHEHCFGSNVRKVCSQEEIRAITLNLLELISQQKGCPYQCRITHSIHTQLDSLVFFFPDLLRLCEGYEKWRDWRRNQDVIVVADTPNP